MFATLTAPTSTVAIENRHTAIDSRPPISAPQSTMQASMAPVLDESIRAQIARALRLDELLSRITPENSHAEVFSDGPVGNEEW
jgi:hypothetical protein